MSWLAEDAILRRHFRDGWNDETPISEPNANLNVDALLEQRLPYVRISVLRGLARKATAGGTQDRARHDAEFVVEIFSAPGRGDGEALRLANRAAELFRGFYADGFTFWEPRLITVGSIAKGWYQLNVLCPYQREVAHAL